VTTEHLVLRSRSQVYLVLIGIVAGMLIAGLAVPLVFADGSTPKLARSSSSNVALGGSGTGADAVADPAAASGPGSTAVTAATGAATASGRASAATTIAGRTATPKAPVAGSQPASGGAVAAAPVPGAAVPASGAPIKIGALLLDLGNVGRLGFEAIGITPDDQRTAWQAYFDDINASGGISGHPIQAVYQTYDPLSEDNMRAACLALTQDAKVFAVVDAAGFVGSPVLCVTEENRTPFLLMGSSGVTQEDYDRSGGRLFSVFQGEIRGMRNFGVEVDRLGVAKGKKIGIMYDLRSGSKLTADTLQQSLEQLGYQVTYRSEFSADLQTGSAQVPVEVNQMRAKGVDVVLNLANTLYATQFAQAADAQHWYPRYVNDDWNGANSDFYYQNMPASYDGSLVVTITRTNESKANMPEPAIDAQCRARAAKALGKPVDRDSSADGMITRICAVTQILRPALTNMNGSFTAAGFAPAMQKLGKLNLAAIGGASFVPGRFDGADQVRTMHWEAGCKCLKPQDAFRATRY
jgi:ABC-type branched-subunit amino acid transport system substrate-binding protein